MPEPIETLTQPTEKHGVRYDFWIEGIQGGIVTIHVWDGEGTVTNHPECYEIKHPNDLSYVIPKSGIRMIRKQRVVKKLNAEKAKDEEGPTA